MALLKEHVADVDTTLLDLGCGRGSNLAFVSKQFPMMRTTGIDVSLAMCKSAGANSPTSEVICGFYGPDSPFLQGSEFDVVMARSTLTYVDEQDISNVQR